MQLKVDYWQPYPISKERDLDFAKADTFYATHRLHSFSAKFPPQLPTWGLTTFSQPGDWVLDPFVGSGTLLVEAQLNGRNSLGIDIDPLARLIAKVKATPLDPKRLESQCQQFAAKLATVQPQLQQTRNQEKVADLLAQYQASIPDFPNRDYWFLPPVQEELALLKALISRQSPPDFVDFLYVVFSAVIITKGKTSVANVRDLAHSRPHYAEPKSVPDVFGQFQAKLERTKNSVLAFSDACVADTQSHIIGDDARKIPLAANSVDLIFTSPPYVNAIDYPRAHKFSIFWLPEFFQATPDAYRDLGRQYVGTDRVPLAECRDLVDYRFAVDLLDNTIATIARMDIKQAGVTSRYFQDMRAVLGEMCRVLRFNKKAILVVSPSNIKTASVETQQILAMLAENVRISDQQTGEVASFQVEEIALRVLDDSKRQLPYIRGSNGVGMRNEYVIILEKIAKG